MSAHQLNGTPAGSAAAETSELVQRVGVVWRDKTRHYSANPTNRYRNCECPAEPVRDSFALPWCSSRFSQGTLVFDREVQRRAQLG